MCVIIDRQPGVVIPAKMLEKACDINKHGYGLAYPKNGKLHFLRSLENNDPKIVADLLQKLKDHRVFLHLRHATVGKVTPENSHPFHILHKSQHGVDVAWMHNGTLYEYKPKDITSPESDTLIFHREIVEPTALRIVKYTKKIVEDKIFQHILLKDTGYSSIFFVFDGQGNTFTTNKDKGAQFEGWWASNDYSFQENHPRSSTYTPPKSYGSHYSPWCGYDTVDPWEDTDPKTIQMTDWEQALRKADEKAKNPPTTTRIKYECVQIKDMLFNTKGESIMKDNRVSLTDLKVLKETFTQLSGLNSLDGVGRLSEGDLVMMAQTYPIGTARLVLELFAEKLELEVRNKNLSACLKETA